VAKLSVTVDLLLGNIPERTSFLVAGLKVALAPYLQLAQVLHLNKQLASTPVMKTSPTEYENVVCYGTLPFSDVQSKRGC
jgi:hypothetical protein